MVHLLVDAYSLGFVNKLILPLAQVGNLISLNQTTTKLWT